MGRISAEKRQRHQAEVASTDLKNRVVKKGRHEREL